MTQVIPYKSIDLSKISYTKPSHQQNVYIGNISYNKDIFNLQSAKLKVKEIKNDKSIIFEETNDNFSFYDSLLKLDDHTLASTYKSSKDWFNKELPMDVLEKMYRRITKPFKKGERPIVEFKLPPQKQKTCTCYDEQNNEISFDLIKPGSVVVLLLRIKSLKFLRKDYYCDICISQIKLCQVLESSECLIEDEDQSIYDYEILDEEVLIKNKEKIELNDKITQLKNKMEEDKKQLAELMKKIKTFN